VWYDRKEPNLLGIQKQILGFEVSMYISLGVHVANSRYDLPEKLARFILLHKMHAHW
jgi:hypothetical protein